MTAQGRWLPPQRQLELARDKLAAALPHHRRVQRSGNADALLYAERRVMSRRREVERWEARVQGERSTGGVSGRELRGEAPTMFTPGCTHLMPPGMRERATRHLHGDIIPV